MPESLRLLERAEYIVKLPVVEKPHVAHLTYDQLQVSLQARRHQ